MNSQKSRREESKEDYDGSSSSSVSSSSSSSVSSSSSDSAASSGTCSSSQSLPSTGSYQNRDGDDKYDQHRVRQQEDIVLLSSTSLLRRRPTTTHSALLAVADDIDPSITTVDPVLLSKAKASTKSDNASKRRRSRRSQSSAEGRILAGGGNDNCTLRPRTRRRSCASCKADCCSGMSTVLVGTSLLVWLACVVIERSGDTMAPRRSFVRYNHRHQKDGRQFPIPPPLPPPHAMAHLRGREAPLNVLRLPLPYPTSSTLLKSVREWIQSIFSPSEGSSTSLVSGGNNNYHRPSLHSNSQHNINQKRDMESLDVGCEHDDWQLGSHPTCNRLHEIDFASVIWEWKRQLHHARQQQLLQSRASSSANASSFFAGEDSNGSRIPSLLGYISDSGLWRTVWAVPDADVVDSSVPGRLPLVLKLMKQEHELNARNLDRHRREALVMDRLTSSPYISNLYGYCGTTVLTEFLGETLHQLLKSEEDRRPSPLIRPSWGIENNRTAALSRSTPQRRLRLALHAARGVQALHENSIVHADVQDQQFLVGWSSSSSLTEPQPRLVLNDFNRCRFLAYRRSGSTNETTRTTQCPFRIPSAPGSSRAPEEYAFEDLTEQIDVYSLANVLHQILTGEDPWGGWSVLEVTNQVQKGVKPVAPPEMLEHPSDALLQNLTLRAYELDPNVRIHVRELVQQLEWAMNAYFGGE